jgi:putative transposase
MLHQKLDYVHNNLVVAGLVEKPEDNLYSSARDYYCLPGLLDVILVEPVLQ